jgi:hypothetical protein
MANNAQFVATPKNGVAQVSTANTARDGTGALATVYTAGANGSRIDSLVVQATATTTAGMIRLFISDGSNNRLVTELPVVAVTPSGTIPAWNAEVRFDGGLVLQATWTLQGSTNNAETFNIIPTVAGDF